jgi:HEAT repeat protein
MGTVLFVILLALVVLLAAFAIYMLLRILKVYAKARRLETMRSYETIVYSALQKLSPEIMLNTLLPDPDPEALEEVLLRMADEGTPGLKQDIMELYRISGFAGERMRQFGSRSKSRRSDAARRLGRIGDPRAVPGLAELLGDPKPEVREAALFALGRIGTGESLELMLDALGSGDRWSQEKVSEVVEKAGDKSRRLLVDLLRDEDPSRRAFAAEIMGRVAGDQEAEYLERALEDEDVNVRARAADSLGRMRNRAARPALLRALEDPAWEVRAQAVKALGSIGDEEDTDSIAPALRDGEWWVRSNTAAALREMGETGEGPLVEMLWDEDRFAREAAAQALEEGSIVERLVEDMRKGGENPEAGRVIRRLAEIGSVGTIAQVLKDMQERELKRRLVELLAGTDDPELDKALAAAEREIARADARQAQETDDSEDEENTLPPPGGGT